MPQFTDEQFDLLEQKVLKYMQEHREMNNFSLGKVRFGLKAIDHLKGLDKKHIRNKQNIYMRYICALSIQNILEHTGYYQEYKKEQKTFKIKRQGVYISEIKDVEYFGFVAIVPTGKGSHRIKIIVEKVSGWSHYDILSVIPARNRKGGYSRFDSQMIEEFFD